MTESSITAGNDVIIADARGRMISIGKRIDQDSEDNEDNEDDVPKTDSDRLLHIDVTLAQMQTQLIFLRQLITVLIVFLGVNFLLTLAIMFYLALTL